MERRILISRTAGILLGVSMLAAIGLRTSALAQEEVRPKASIRVSAPQVRPGAPIQLTVTVDIPSGWHGYQNPPSKDYQIPITVEAGDKATKVTKVSYPKGSLETFGGEATMVYSGKVSIPVTVKAQASEGTQTVRLKVGYQLCNEGSCLPPNSLNLAAQVKVSKKAPKAPAAPGTPRR
jgi:DsbC/DsbD-like thiol-disulfide interchange protein